MGQDILLRAPEKDIKQEWVVNVKNCFATNFAFAVFVNHKFIMTLSQATTKNTLKIYGTIVKFMSENKLKYITNRFIMTNYLRKQDMTTVM